MSVSLHDSRTCRLGEGPLWHPERGQLFWFDILGGMLLTQTGDGPASWEFGEHVSAAGWIDLDHLLIASESRLFSFRLGDGRQETVCDLEAEDASTRSNDGRADPWGGFWIGTMGKGGERNAGAIYRWHGGELRRLRADVTVPNAICFSPDGKLAYFTDSADGRIMCQDLRPGDGWPDGEPRAVVDLGREPFVPDGMVVDSQGFLWNAQWGGGRVARYSPDGGFDREIEFPTPQVSCPAFGGPDLSTLHVTTAATGLDPGDAFAGQTFSVQTGCTGVPECRVAL